MGEVGGDPMSPLSSPPASDEAGVSADPCGVIERPSFSFCYDNGASYEEEIRLLLSEEVVPVEAVVADCPLVDISSGEVGRADGLFCPSFNSECVEAERGETSLRPEPMQHPLLGLGMQEEKSQAGPFVSMGETLQLEAEVATFAAIEKLAPDDENCSSKVSSDAGNGASTCCKPITTFRRSNPKRAASLRSSMADRSTRTKNGASRCSNAADTRALIISRITKRVTGKRNISRRAAQGRVWGAIDELVKDFEQNCFAIKLHDKRSKKGSSASGKQKRHTASRCMGLRVSKTKTAASSNPLYLKNQRFQHPLSCDADGLQASVPSTLADFKTKTDTDIDKRSSKVRYNLGGRTCRARTKPLKCGGMHGDKDLESTLTHDTSVVCDQVLFSSGTVALLETVDDNCLLESGTSPDSAIYHPTNDIGSITSGLTTPPNQVSGRAQCQVVTKSMAQFELHADVSTYSEAVGTHASDSPSDMQMHTNHKKGKKGKKKGNINGCSLPLSEDIINKEEFRGLKNLSEATKTSNYSIPEWNLQGVFTEGSPKYIKKPIRNGLNCNNYRPKSSLPGMTELESYENFMELVIGSENPALSGHDVENADSEVGALGGSLLTDETKAYKVPGGTKEGSREGRQRLPDSARQMMRNSRARKDNLCKPHIKGKAKEKNGTSDVCKDASGGMRFSFGIASKANDGSKVVSVDVSNSVMDPLGDQLAPKESCSVLEGQSLRPRAAWVLCDDCNKWRCIPAELADIIDETDCKWTCKDNKDKVFADCSIPQEKTDDEINAELELQDSSGVEYSSHALLNLTAIEPSKPAGSKPTSWTSIKSNSFLHRNRRTQTIDEIMVCHCKPPLNGGLGCGEECLNRMLNIECVKGTCPSGDLCSNQQFQKRKYAKFKWFRCGKKGHGLQLQENVSCGQFLIEYVGEVLDFTAYEARQRYYASGGQKHFYFMTLNGGEVIDACTKGNLGRFINHSCNPNCRTEKWMVNGEVCIGLFAIRDIKKGEEVTFDYKFVRVFGAAVKKCFCGAAQCRGYIGSDPSDAAAIVQGDSDEEYPELVDIHRNTDRDVVVDMTVSTAIDAKIVKHEEIPIRTGGSGRVLDIDGAVSSFVDVKVVENEEIPIRLMKYERDLSIRETISDTIVANVVKHEENIIQNEQSNRCTPALQELEDTSCKPLSDGYQLGTSLQPLDSIPAELAMSRVLSDAEVLEDSSHSSSSIQSEETVCRSVSDVQLLVVSPGTSSIPNESIITSSLGNEKLMVNNLKDKLNILKPHSPIKPPCPKVSVKVTPCIKSVTSHTDRAKRMPISSSNRHFEGVEEKLNGLLDGDGGISKGKDATKGYLKLLVLTAAEEGFSSQRTRDLSLILDALQKTKSRMVLGDIISKNGLQMLHNILKQNRSNYSRTPIIRKVLKVLAFLAEKEILTLEHINTSSRSGVESFKDTISYLTRHNNTEVHKFARNFRDKLNQWIPLSTRRVDPLGRENKLNSQHSYYSSYQSSSSFKCHEQGTRDTAAIVRIGEAVRLLGPSSETDMPGGVSMLPSPQVYTSVPMTDHSTASGTRIRKRKTGWDQPLDVTSTDTQSLRTTEDQTVETSSKFMKLASAHLEQTSQFEIIKQISKTHQGSSSYDDSMQQNTDDEAPPGFGSPCKNIHPRIPHKMFMVADDVNMVDHLQKDDEAPPGFGFRREDLHPRISSGTSVVAGDVLMSPQMEDEAPPGFGSPRKGTHPPISSGTSVVEEDVVMASLQERFLPHLSVSYGMPAALMQQLGTPETDGGRQCFPGWAVAPGMPFHTFPPLPSYPRRKPNLKPLSPTSSDYNLNRKQIEELQPAKECHAERAVTSVSGEMQPANDCHAKRAVTSVSGERLEHVETVTRNSDIRERVRWPSRGSEGRLFRTQGRGNQRFDRCCPPRPREGNNSGFRGNTRNGTYSTRIGNRKDFNSDGGNRRFDRWQPSMPREGDYSGFRDSTRNGTSGTCIGSKKGFSSDDSCIREDLNNGDSSTKFRHNSHRCIVEV